MESRSRTLKITRITIIGLGQIGGSLVLALRKSGIKLHITGVENRRNRLRLMRKHVDLALSSARKMDASDLTVLCLHARPLLQFLKTAPAEMLLMDVCSGKQEVMKIAARRRLRFIGGHPMAGNEHPGEKGWDSNLFKGAPFFLCPIRKITSREIRAVKQLIRRIGGLPVEINAAEHDRSVAHTSHFPAFLSVMLAQSAQEIPNIFKGPGFTSMTRLSKTSPVLLETFLQMNRTNVLHAARNLERKLHRWIETQSQRRMNHRDTEPQR